MNRLENAPLHSLAEMVRTGDLDAVDLAAHCLSRHEENSDLKAITWIDPDSVLRAAEAVDRARVRGDALGSLAGIPFVVKDNIDTRGFPTTAGSHLFRNLMPGSNAAVVTQIENCGGILLGKTNMHELAMGGTTDNPAFGTTLNPYNHEYGPGGSSGGSGAAVAAGIAPIALASDTGGSIRIPASCCGVAGLRPSMESRSRKTYPDTGLTPAASDFDIIGPIARTVEDLAYFDAAIRNVQIPVMPAGTRLRIGVPTSYYYDALDPAVQHVVAGALDRLRAADHELIEIDLSTVLNIIIPPFAVLLNGGLWHDIRAFLRIHAQGTTMDQLVREIRDSGARHMLEVALAARPTAMEITQARSIRTAARKSYVALMKGLRLDAIAFPTSPIMPPIRHSKPEVLTQFRNTLVGAFLGLPGLSIPAGLSSEGLPIGIELDGYPGGDTALLAIGIVAEKALGRIALPRTGQ